MKEKLLTIWKKLWQNIAGYKVTMAAIILWTFFVILSEFTNISYGTENRLWDSLSRITNAAFVFLILFAAAILLCEIRFPKKYGKWLFICLPAAVLSGILTCIHLWERSFLGISENRAENIMIGYILLMLLFILYFSFQKSAQPFFAYAPILFFYLMTAFFIWLILYLGAFSIFGIIDSLLIDLDSRYWDWEIIISVILVGCGLIPFCLTALSLAEKESAKEHIAIPLLRVIIKYLLTGISMGVLCICYLYMLKILILREIPSNEIFTDVAILFCMGAPVWMADENYLEDNFYSRLICLLPYFLVPLVILQTWSLGQRIGQYGLTPERYLGIALILFEICFILFWKWFRQNGEKLLLIAAGLVTVSCLLPFVNMYTLSLRNQQYFLDLYTAKVNVGEELTKEEADRAKGAYHYVRRNGDQEPEYYEAFYRDLLDAVQTLQTEIEQTRTAFHACQLVGTLDTEGYHTFHMLKQSAQYESDSIDPSILDFSHFLLYKRELGEDTEAGLVEVDLSEIWDQILAYKKENPYSNEDEDTAFLKPLNRIEIDENRVFYLNHFEIVYYNALEEQISDIRSVNISGMLLEK